MYFLLSGNNCLLYSSIGIFLKSIINNNEIWQAYWHCMKSENESWCSNGNASETKANESFDNGVFFDIEAKRTPSIVTKLFSKRNEHIR